MLTSYDVLTAGIFEQAGVRALLVGDTGAEMVLGYDSTLPVTMAELISMTRVVVAGTRTALVVADLSVTRFGLTHPEYRPTNLVDSFLSGVDQVTMAVLHPFWPGKVPAPGVAGRWGPVGDGHRPRRPRWPKRSRAVRMPARAYVSRASNAGSA
jgi:Ketopantoate hydroxymethyltransferase